MKLIKKITAAVTAMAIAVGMMSVGASAETWSVYFYPAQAPNGIKYIDQKNFASTDTISYFYDSCQNYTQTPNNHGDVAYVDYWAYSADSSGTAVALCTSYPNYTYYSPWSETKRTLVYNCDPYYTFVVKHRDNVNGNNSSMSGTVSLTKLT